MQSFKSYIESSLRQQLKVPQNPRHHPEGDVDRHTMMVRFSLESAIDLLRSKQLEDPDGPLSNLDLDFSTDEINILRLAGLLHDIGKGDALNPETLSAYGHEDPKIFEKGMSRLSSIWQNMYKNSSDSDRNDLWWVIRYHMSLNDDRGFERKSLKSEILDNDGKYKNERRIKLLLVLLLMDRMGKGGEGGVSWRVAKDFARKNIEAGRSGLGGIYRTSELHRKNLSDRLSNSGSIGDSPEEAVINLRGRGRNSREIRMALNGMVKNGKFNLSSDEIDRLVGESFVDFRDFMESVDEPSITYDNIPLGKFEKGSKILSKVFRDAGKIFYVVGGTVRDYLMSKYHGVPFEIKDVDFATDALSGEVIEILSDAGIKYVPKGEAFGVISAIVDGHEFEIATFREESGYEDKRRPSIVRASDAKNDYRRRDFTFNALYYEIPVNSGDRGKIIDYGGGRGLEDIMHRRVSTVGSAHDRFSEDPLRVMRGVRFHGIFNNDNLKDVIDSDTLDAMKRHSDLAGVSPERIQAEFVSSLIKSRDPRVVLRGFQDIGALPYIFPGMNLDMNSVDVLENLPIFDGLDKGKHNMKRVVLSLAFLLRKSGNPDEIRMKLNKMKWPNDMVDEIIFLIKSWILTKNPNSHDMAQHAISMEKKNSNLRRELLKDFNSLVSGEVDSSHLLHLSDYIPKKFDGNEIKSLGLKGAEIGNYLKNLQSSDYEKSYNLKGIS